ncbi:BC1881 family protein [Brevibacillus laterosporus]|uniref:BC1881 family protein n=1 Tax=Brevibacillus laterosporus TaxID=1465 RepID=UPI000EB4D2F5|nr:BC1881 family protein [Brevibacillus laterosporus]AYK08871.1 BC1881 family protein [Brevibacillus laterosporus]
MASNDSSFKVNIDVSDGLKSLEEIRRSAEAATISLSKFERTYERVTGLTEPDLSSFSTKELQEELASRLGVTEHILASLGYCKLIVDHYGIGQAETIEVTGPAHILINQDR